MKLIIARNACGNIDFPTSLPDRQRYQALTVGGVCLYGKTTWDTLPPAARRNRTSIIIRQSLTDTYGAAEFVPGGHFFSSTQRNIMGDLGWTRRDDLWICGGKKVYDSALFTYPHLITHIYLSTFADESGSLHVDLPSDDGTWDRICQQKFEDHTFEILRRKV